MDWFPPRPKEATKTEKVDNLLAQLEEQRKAMMHVGASCEITSSRAKNFCGI